MELNQGFNVKTDFSQRQFSSGNSVVAQNIYIEPSNHLPTSSVRFSHLEESSLRRYVTYFEKDFASLAKHHNVLPLLSSVGNGSVVAETKKYVGTTLKAGSTIGSVSDVTMLEWLGIDDMRRSHLSAVTSHFSAMEVDIPDVISSFLMMEPVENENDSRDDDLEKVNQSSNPSLSPQT